MGSIRQTLDTAFRDYEVANDPASGIYEPEKAKIRALGPLLEYELAKNGLSAEAAFEAARAADLASERARAIAESLEQASAIITALQAQVADLLIGPSLNFANPTNSMYL